jgi:hypothetical protein
MRHKRMNQFRGAMGNTGKAGKSKERKAHQVRVSGVGDGHDTDSEESTGSGTKGDVGSLVSVNGSLGEHGVVLNLGSSKRGSVLREKDELG